MFNTETPTTADERGATTNQPNGQAAQPAYPFRLLKDETVLGMYPIAEKRRPLGRLVSYLFVTDSRVIYSAEAKTVSSSSIHMKEYQVPTINGFEVGRHRGLDSYGLAAAIGVVLNIVGVLILAGIVNSAASSGGGGSYGDLGLDNPLSGMISVISSLSGFFAVSSIIVGITAIILLRRPAAVLRVVGPREAQTLTQGRDLPTLLITILLFLIFGLLFGLFLIAWAIIRELGVFTADDAQLYAKSENIDRIAYEVGALVIDVQARGKLAGKE